MGDEQKIKKLAREIEEIYEIVAREKLNSRTKLTINEKYMNIKEIYKDFMDNYLDFIEISDNLYDGIYISDGKGKTLFVNEAYTRTTGITKNEVVGRTVKEISDEGKLYKGAVTMEVLEKKEVVNSLGKSFKNDKDLLVTGTPIFDEEGNVRLVVINNRDISGLKELEQKIAELQHDKLRASEEIKYLRNQQMSQNMVVYDSEYMIAVMDLVSTIAPTDVTVLITGESGTGKEVIADEIYHRSNRKNKPFIKVNCAAIPGELLESELFGYEGGAFTDAKKSGKIGLFELANGGTILLDEIGEIPIRLQSKLLRVLQTWEILRIGGNKSIKLDVRIIASTNRDLLHEIKEGRFREDLYYRLNVVPIRLKPLRERREAVSSLSINFLNKFNRKYGKNVIIENDAMELLKIYNWPGNIRELENLIERMVVINNDGFIKYSNLFSILDVENLNYLPVAAENIISLKAAVHSLEKEVIINSLRRCGSLNKAAARLGLSQPALWKKCRTLNIDTNNL